MTIAIENLSKIYNPDSEFPVHAVRRLSLTIEQGEFVAIMGPSGSGKTTLLNLLGGIDTPSEGQITIDGDRLSDLTPHQMIAFRRDNVGFIFQDYSLLPVLTALENVEFVMQLQGHSEKACRARATELLTQVGLGDQLNKVPAKLSGGQQQRVAVARALAPRPRFVMADEPTANLDARSTAELMDIMQQLNEKEGITFLFSTHDPRVITRARRVIVIEDGQITEDRPQ
ncbi:ABC transporter ATP-binding protein [Ferrimonas balearica]|uniref:ABC transporter ATP-binding protein n=1 Tax=Ferrimonas balearica TaxID=44012 RepID=UPI001C99F741|nr:ABC transporter ATP-binding protein [Ferrimonas balearica]MBY5991224.1 ABC transporter ATP-binding protein [Ferrimonas balearica]